MFSIAYLLPRIVYSHVVERKMLRGTRAGLSWWCRLFDIGLFLILLGAALQVQFVDANEWECGQKWCYKLSNTAANQSAANKTCSNQGTSLADVTPESHWKSFLAFTDKKTKNEPEYSQILWSSLVVKRVDGVTEILTPDLQNGSCEAKVCQDFLGSVTRDGVWCAVLNIGKTTTLSAEDCKAEHSFVCQKPVGEEEAYKIMGLNIELFAAFIVLLYLFIVFVISIIWGTYIENKKAEEYAVINREYYAKSKKPKKHEVKPIVVMESNA